MHPGHAKNLDISKEGVKLPSSFSLLFSPSSAEKKQRKISRLVSFLCGPTFRPQEQQQPSTRFPALITTSFRYKTFCFFFVSLSLAPLALFDWKVDAKL